MKYSDMTKNHMFREFSCGLSIEETAKLCFKNIATVKGWDKGKPIPKECKRLMRMHRRLELSHYEDWRGFKVKGERLELPTGEAVTPQQVLTGIALLQIQSELEIKTSSKLLKLARAISNINFI